MRRLYYVIKTNPALYVGTQIILALLVLAILYFIYKALEFAFNQNHFSENRSKKLLLYILTGLVLWLGILAVTASFGFFLNFDTLPPRIGIAMMPPLVLILVLLFSSAFYKVLKSIPPAWLINVQSIRIPVEIVLWMGLLGGFVPFQMTFEGFNYDIIVGITAIMAGYIFFGKGRFRRPEAILWNISGIVLLLFIVFISVISTPSPLRVFYNEPANTFMAHFPFIWIPGFIVPFALAMHLFSLKQLFMKKRN